MSTQGPMYTAYFGLKEDPFSLTPNPRFLFLSQRHREALAHLLYGMGERGGFVLLTGEVGTGKTTLCRSLLEQIPEGVEVALVLNPKQTALELVASLCDELKITYPEGATSLKLLIDLLNRRLLQIHARGRRTVLIIDEAQNLSSDVLEQVRLLTNLETTTSKLLQILLIGQPELQDMMARPELRQLGQRITARYHLSSLMSDETTAYVQHRMEVAGSRRRLFTSGSLRLVHTLSGGIPRVVNNICDRALLGAYARQMERIDPRLVREAASEVMGPKRLDHPLVRMRWVVVLAACVMLWAGWQLFLHSRMEIKTDMSEEKAQAGISASRSGDREPPSIRAGEDTAPAPFSGPERGPAEKPLASLPGIKDQKKGTQKAETPASVLAEQLLAETVATDLETAFSVLFTQWQTAYPAEPGMTPCERAARAGFRCYENRGNWTTLRHLDRPAILELVDRHQRRHHVPVIRLEGDHITVFLDDREITLRQIDIDPCWFGDFILLWRPPPLASPVIKEGDRGPDVIWLLTQLDRVEGVHNDDFDQTGQAPSPNPLFDSNLKERVTAFQQAHFVKPDGIVGEQTLIQLNRAATGSIIPLLCPRPMHGEKHVINP